MDWQYLRVTTLPAGLRRLDLGLVSGFGILAVLAGLLWDLHTKRDRFRHQVSAD